MLRGLIFFVLLSVSPAYADHGIFNASASSASANTVLQLEQQIGRYELGEDRGQFVLSYLQIEVALLEQLSVIGGIPWVTLTASDSSSIVGQGDSMTGLKYQLTASDTHRFDTSLGVNVEWPTGDTRKRIGGGHYGIEGVFSVAKSLSNQLTLVSRLSHSVAPDHSHGHNHDHDHDHGHDHEHDNAKPGHGGVIRPHGEHESTALVSLVYSTEMQFVETAIRGGVTRDQNEFDAAPLDLILRAGFNIGKRTTVVSSLSQTVAGQLRTPWTFSLGLTVNYERHTHSHDEEPHDHHNQGDDNHDHNHHDHHDHPHARS